ncbi:TetR/AcrR family transcriptional regulator [Nonomuraea sp. NPDC048882]|uniref:TetR/AcrR family transcriptional regulator n=1 Tax=Nonomuraea sp. NPDC048882 TaxID=3154347 RepID=UPI0033C65F06
MELFLAEGYARVSMDAIAARARVGKQTVYSHFGNKERLFLAVVGEARTAASATPGGSAATGHTGDPRTDLQAVGERLLRVVLSPAVAALYRLTIAELTHQPELQQPWRERIDHPGSPSKRCRTRPLTHDQVPRSSDKANAAHTSENNAFSEGESRCDFRESGPSQVTTPASSLRAHGRRRARGDCTPKTWTHPRCANLLAVEPTSSLGQGISLHSRCGNDHQT